MKNTQEPKVAWYKGKVDPREEHIEIRYGERHRPVARVARDVRKQFTVQFLLAARSGDARRRKLLDEVSSDLDRYLLELVGPDSWAFVQFHCGTAANRCSNVHWSWHPKITRRMARVPREPQGRRVVRVH